MHRRKFRQGTLLLLVSLLVTSCLLCWSGRRPPLSQASAGLHCISVAKQTGDVATTTVFAFSVGDSRRSHGNDQPSVTAQAQVMSDVSETKPSWLETTRKRRSQTGFCPPLPRPFPVGASFFPCRWRVRQLPCVTRLRVALVCSSTTADIALQMVPADTPPVSVTFDDSCLERAVKRRCYADGLPVPRLVHYVSLSRQRLAFHTFLSALSAVSFLNPCLLLFHGDSLPFGPLWRALLQLVPGVVHVSRDQPTSIFGHKVDAIQHRADVVRLEAVTKFGGLYLDMDQLLLKPLDDLRQHDVTLGVEFTGSGICNAVYLARPQAAFLPRWYDSYKTFNDSWWMQHSGEIPYQMALRSPGEVTLVHTFFSPNFKNMTPLYEGTYDWRQNHGVHLYYRFNIRYFDGVHLEWKNSSLGEIARHILFGSSTECAR